MSAHSEAPLSNVTQGQIVGLRNMSDAQYEVIGISGLFVHLRNLKTNTHFDAIIHLLDFGRSHGHEQF